MLSRIFHNDNNQQYGPRVQLRQQQQQQELPAETNNTSTENQTNSSDAEREEEEEHHQQQKQKPSDKRGPGILIRTLKPGDSTNYPQPQDTCRVHYEAYILSSSLLDDDIPLPTKKTRRRSRARDSSAYDKQDEEENNNISISNYTSTKIDSSRDRNQCFLFQLNSKQVLKGWEIAIPKMSRGQIAEITVPSLYAYGERGYPPLIPPNTNLLFEIELIDFAPSSEEK